VKTFNLRARFNSKLIAIVTNTGWLFADRILRMGAGLVVGVWIARYLGAEQFGLFSYATAFAALFSPLATMGLDNVVIHHLTRKSSSPESILGTAFLLRCVGSIVSIVLAVAAIMLFRHNETTTIAIVAILASSSIFQTFDTIDLLFQSQVQAKYTVIAKSTAFAVVSVLKVMLIQTKAPLIAFAWIGLVEVMLGALGLVIVYWMRGYLLRLWAWSLPLAKLFVKQSLPLMLSGLTIMLYLRIDQIMLGQIIGDQAVGIYSAATRISEVWYFIPLTITSSINPSIYSAKEQSESLYYSRIYKLLQFLVVLAIAISLPMTFLSSHLILALFGAGYAESANVLAIHIWASVFVFMGVATSAWFVAEDLTHLSFSRNLMGAIMNIGINFLLIPKYAEVGAAIATVISYAFASFLSNAFSKKTRHLFILQAKALFLPFHKSAT
jgi:polysaccharide transporter, PST family